MKVYKTFTASNKSPVQRQSQSQPQSQSDSDPNQSDRNSLKKMSEINEIAIDRDLNQLFTALNGRLQFGTATTGFDGVNIQGKYKQFTTTTANTEVTVAHGLGYVPNGRLVIWQDVAGSLYQGPSTGTAWTSTNAYFKADTANVTFMVFFY